MIAGPQPLPMTRTLLESVPQPTGWAMLLRGAVAVIFGVVAFRSPNIAAGAFVIVFSIYAFADGVLDFVLAAQLGRAGQPWGWYLFAGIVTFAAGVVALAYPAVTLLAAVILVAVRAIVMGVLEIVAAFSWAGLGHRWLLGLTGVLSIVLGLLLLGSPAVGALALLWTIGVYAIVFGVMLFGLGIRILLGAEKSEGRFHHGHRPAATVG